MDNLLITSDLEALGKTLKNSDNFEEGTYKKGDKPSDFVSHKSPIEEDDAEKQYQELCKKYYLKSK